MIHFISSRDRIGFLILTSLALHHWSVHGDKSCSSFTVTYGPSLQSLRLALHTCNQSIEPSHLLISPPWSHDSMLCLICNELLYHLLFTCGLITCVSHINTISPPKLSLNYQNQTFHVACYWYLFGLHTYEFLPTCSSSYSLYKEKRV